jgi:hypothetical protein
MGVRPDLANLLFINVRRRYRGRLCQHSPRQSAGLQKRSSQSSLMLPLMRLRKRVFAPRRGAAVERVPPLHFAVSACATIRMARHCSSMSMGPPKETPPVTLMNGRATTLSSTSTPLCVTNRKKGPAMAIASARSISTRRKPVDDGAQFSVAAEALFAW